MLFQGILHNAELCITEFALSADLYASSRKADIRCFPEQHLRFPTPCRPGTAGCSGGSADAAVGVQLRDLEAIAFAAESPLGLRDRGNLLVLHLHKSGDGTAALGSGLLVGGRVEGDEEKEV